MNRMTGHPMRATKAFHLRRVHALRHREWTSRRETANGRRVDRLGQFPFDADRFALVARIRYRNCRNERTRIRMLRRADEARLGDERRRNAHALTLAAAHLMRIALRITFRWQPAHVEHARHASRGLARIPQLGTALGWVEAPPLGEPRPGIQLRKRLSERAARFRAA